MDDLLQLRAGNLPFFGVGLLVNEPAVFDAVARAEQQQAFAGQPVATRAARLLIIALDVLRQVVVDDKAHVRFVDAHAEGNRGADDAHLVAEKCFLAPRPLGGFHARVIRRGANTVGVEFAGQRLGRLARLAINNAALARTGAHK